MIFSHRAKLVISASAVFFFIAAFISYVTFSSNRSPTIHIDDSININIAVVILEVTNKDFYNDRTPKRTQFSLLEKASFFMEVLTKKNTIYVSRVHPSDKYEVYYDVNYDSNYNKKIPRKYIVDKNYNIINEEYIGKPIYYD